MKTLNYLIIFLFLSPSVFAIDIIVEKDDLLPLDYVNVVFKGGSVSDPEGKTGLTNFMAEMLLRGTQLRTKDQIDTAIDSFGANLAVDTQAEAVVFRASVISRNLKPLLSLLSEILTQPSWPAVEHRKLKSELISNVLTAKQSDSHMASKQFQRLLFSGHPYGNSTMGSASDLNSITLSDIIGHYKKIFGSNAATILASGELDDESLEPLKKTLENSLPKVVTIAKAPPPPVSNKRRLILLDKPQKTQTQILMGQIAVRSIEDPYFPLYLGNFALGGGGFSSRLMNEIRVKRGWSYSVYSSFSHRLQRAAWNVGLMPASKDAANALELTLKLIDEWKEQGLKPSEFEFSKEAIVNKMAFIGNTPAERIENKISEIVRDLPEGFYDHLIDKVSEVSFSEANQALSNEIKPETFIIVVLCTANELKASLAKAAGVPESEVIVIPYDED